MALKDLSLADSNRTLPLNLDLLSPKELLRLRAEIDQRLDLGSLKSIDLGEELALQLKTAKLLLQDALADEDTAFGQKAQTAMVLQRLLQDLVKMRTELYNAEALKALEQMLIDAFREVGSQIARTDTTSQEMFTEVKDAFFASYERLLAKRQEEFEAQ